MHWLRQIAAIVCNMKVDEIMLLSENNVPVIYYTKYVNLKNLIHI